MDDSPATIDEMKMRSQIFQALIEVLKPLEFTLALWQAGSAAHRRVDQWSDLDVILVVRDEFVPPTFTVVEQTLATLAPISFQYRVPEPTWHGHAQCFYQLEGLSPYWIVDLAVMQLSNPRRFLEVERHGDPVVGFDKANLVVPKHINQDTHNQAIVSRLQWLDTTFMFWQSFVKKDVERKFLIDAVSAYHTWTLPPLIELLNMRYRPYRYDFKTKYFSRELPEYPSPKVNSKPASCVCT
ncbi:MAG: nucleotidyltransferase domain-containing protein [Cyanobacteria bacterium P01_A01_bin.17]